MRAYLLRLVEVITTSSVKPIGAVVDVKDFQARTEPERKWLTGATYSPEFRKWEDSGSPNRPYYLGFNECLESAAARVKNPKWQVSFSFDRQNVLAPYALEYYQRAKVLAPPRLAKLLGDITFKSSAGVGALQAADMLAHAAIDGLQRRWESATNWTS